MTRIVILGAGPTGLSAAYHFEQAGYFDYQIFEKDSSTGGLCRSVYQDGFTFDYTGHLLHINDRYFEHFITTVVGMQHLNAIQRRSYIFSHGVYTQYPFQINLHGLPYDVIIECIEGYIKRRVSRAQPRSFYEWALRAFGRGIARHFFFPYQKKIFSYDVKKLSASWTGRFVPSTTLKQMLQGALAAPEETTGVGYNAHFLYPHHHGISFWVDKLRAQLRNPVHTNHTVTQIDVANKRVLFSNGHIQPYDTLINTIPLDILLQCLQEPARLNVQSAHTKLLCNAVINFNLGINRPHLSDKHWIYFPEPQFPFYRIGFPHNFSSYTVPHGCSSLYGEFSYLPHKQANTKHLLKRALNKTKELLQLTDADICTQVIIPISHAYVIYDTWRDQHIDKIHARLQEYNIYSVGRYGAWKYSSMQEAVLDGKAIAEQLLSFVPANTYPTHTTV